jgi:hypothetical protein
MPSADFCRPVRIDRSTLSRDSETNGRSPEVSSTAFRTQPADLQPVPLMDMGFAVTCPLARHRMPRIRLLLIGSYVCSTLLSDPASRRRRCALLSLHLHQVVKGTFTPKREQMILFPSGELVSDNLDAPSYYRQDAKARKNRSDGSLRRGFLTTLQRLGKSRHGRASQAAEALLVSDVVATLCRHNFS